MAVQLLNAQSYSSTRCTLAPLIFVQMMIMTVYITMYIQYLEKKNVDEIFAWLISCAVQRAPSFQLRPQTCVAPLGSMHGKQLGTAPFAPTAHHSI